jgi:hypothetical protein
MQSKRRKQGAWGERKRRLGACPSIAYGPVVLGSLSIAVVLVSFCPTRVQMCTSTCRLHFPQAMCAYLYPHFRASRPWPIVDFLFCSIPLLHIPRGNGLRRARHVRSAMFVGRAFPPRVCTLCIHIWACRCQFHWRTKILREPMMQPYSV